MIKGISLNTVWFCDNKLSFLLAKPFSLVYFHSACHNYSTAHTYKNNGTQNNFRVTVWRTKKHRLALWMYNNYIIGTVGL